MIATLLSLCLACAPQDAAEEVPSPARVAETEAALEQAFRSGDEKRIQGALEAAQTVPHPAVVKLVARGLHDQRRAVQLATLQALRWNEDGEALEVLRRAHEKRRWVADPELMFASLRAIAQHSDPRSLPLLAQEPFEPHDHMCWRARIFGLARLRTLPALEALLKMLGDTVGGRGERRVAPVMAEMRTALILLTGVDQGLSPEQWERWWRESRKGFRLAPEPPLLPKELREKWDMFWGLPQFYQREQRREDRGREPPAPRSQ